MLALNRHHFENVFSTNDFMSQITLEDTYVMLSQCWLMLVHRLYTGWKYSNLLYVLFTTEISDFSFLLVFLHSILVSMVRTNMSRTVLKLSKTADVLWKKIASYRVMKGSLCHVGLVIFVIVN